MVQGQRGELGFVPPEPMGHPYCTQLGLQKAEEEKTEAAAMPWGCLHSIRQGGLNY